MRVPGSACLTLHLLTAVFLVLGSTASVRAQTLVFEQVGDQPLDMNALEFDQDQTLWGLGNGLFKLQQDSGTWEETNAFSGDFLLVLSPDTLFRSHDNGTARSTDGGHSFFGVYEEGGGLFAADVDGTNEGVVLAGSRHAGTGIAYSTDRGASFTESTFTVSTNWTSQLSDAVEIPDGPAEGRLVAGVFNGIVVSEDGGQTWNPSNIFQDGRYWIQRMETGKHPVTGARRLYASGSDAQSGGVQFYYSDDDGVTWTNAPDAEDTYLFVSVPTTGDLLAVERADGVPGTRLNVWRSTDGAQTWEAAGEIPAEPGDDLISTNDAVIGPDGRMYVAVGRSGSTREWVYRTTEPVVVSNEPPPEVPEEEASLRVYPNPATEFITIETEAEEIEILDVLGRVVLRAKPNERINTSGLPVGNYVIRAGSHSQRITVVR